MMAIPARSAAATMAAASKAGSGRLRRRGKLHQRGHGFNRRDADNGDVEAHVLVGFGDLDDGERAAQGGRRRRPSRRISAPARSMVASVPSMASTATHACAAMTTVWPRSYPAMAPGDGSTVGDVLLLLLGWDALGQTPGFASNGSR